MLNKSVSALLVAATFIASFAAEIPFASAAAEQSNQKGMNLFTYSEQFDNAAWTKTNVTVEANTSTSPLGDMTTDALRGNTTLGQHRTYIATPAILTVGRKVTYSIFAKAGSKNWLLLQVNDSIAATGVNFDLANGVKGTVGSSVTDSRITPVGGGWYRVSVTITNNIASSLSMSVGMENADNSNTFAGTTADTIYLWGAQIEQDSFAHAYNRVLTASVGSVNNVIGGANQSNQKGQNFFSQSQNLGASAWTKTGAFATSSSALAPEGSFTATRMTDTTANSVHATGQSGLPTVSGRIYTFSAYFKYESQALIVLAGNGGDGTAYVYVNPQTGTVTSVGANQLSSGIVSVGNGWYRAWNTFLANVNATNPNFYFAQSVGTLVYAGTGSNSMLLWGAQVEAAKSPGSRPSPYNRTVASAMNTSYIPAGAKQSSQKGQNMLTFSEQFDNAIWANVNVTTAADITTAPNATMTADKITDSSDAGATSHYKDRAVTVVTGRMYTLSVYAKKGTKNFIDLSPDAASVQQNFNVDTCTVGSLLNNSLGAFRSAGTQNAGGGWCRVWVTWVSGGFTDTRIWILNADSSITYTGDGTGTVFLWGAQFEQNGYPRSYNRTTSAAINP